MVELQVPTHVHHQTHEHGGIVLLNTATGKWHALNSSAGGFWTCWAQGIGFEESVAEVAGRYPEVPPERVRADANALVHDLVSRSLLVASLPATSGSATMAGPAAESELRPPWALRLQALCTLVLATLLVKLPFRMISVVVIKLRRRWCRDPISGDRAVTTVSAVRHVADRYPGRTACLEQSLAAVLLAALSRRRLDWCLGTLTDPYRFHAWVETEGRPIISVGDPPHLGYLRVLSL